MEVAGLMKIWTCKIGELTQEEWDELGAGIDSPMRKAVEEAYYTLTGRHEEFIFSGWGGELTEAERAVVEDRLPSAEYDQGWRAGYEAALIAGKGNS